MMAKETKKILIGGEWINGNNTISVHSPYDGSHIADVGLADVNQLNTAKESAVNAASEIKELSRFEIASGLKKIAAEIERRKDEFIETIISESAKPFRYAKGEVERGIATFHWAAGEVERFVGEVVPLDVQPAGSGKTGYTKRVPRGVIYGITPFNFPLNLVAHKVAPALASGNAIIIKPSDRTPLTALLLGEVFLESGLPSSALQVVPMAVDLIDQVYSDERIKMISFTGSAAIGWGLKSKADKKFVTLELGGNAAVIVDSTADIETSVKKCLVGAFSYSGQVCISVQRIYVHAHLFDEWLAKFTDGAGQLVVGDPIDEATELSVVIDKTSAMRIEEWIDEAINSGAKILCGGTRKGNLILPTILTNASAELKVVYEEAFAPLVVIEKFSHFEDAIKMTNQSKYGLQTGVFTNDLRNAQYAIEHLESGTVLINEVPTFRVDNMPYGGVKDSGFGREGVRYAMEEMTEPKLIIIGR